MKRKNLRWAGAGLALALIVLATVAVSCGGELASQDEKAVLPEESGRDLGLPTGEPFVVGEMPPGVDVASEGSIEESFDETASGAVAQSSTLDRKIVQTASLELTVEEVGSSFEEVSRIAAAAGGFVASSTFSRADDEQVASVTIRVPATQYQDVLRQLRGLALEVENESSQANDVTEEYTDLSSRLRNLEATEAQYLLLLGQAKDIGEILQVQDRLNSTRSEIEQVKGRLNLLNNLTDLATVTVHLRTDTAPVVGPETGGGVNPADAARGAWDASIDVLTGISSGIVAVVVFSWWLAPLLALAAFVVVRVLPRAFASRPIDRGGGTA
jgi:hypothetical protein